VLICSGESLYDRARHPDGAQWGELDDHGKAIWRDAEQLISDRLSGDPRYVTVRFSKQLVERMGDDWGVPVQCKLEMLPDGTYDVFFRTVPNIEAPAPLSDEEVARIRAAWEALPKSTRPIIVGEPES
jgi:hypothetical protein